MTYKGSMETRLGNFVRTSFLYRFLHTTFGFCWHRYGDWTSVGCYREGKSWSVVWVDNRQERTCCWCRKKKVNYFTPDNKEKSR